MNAEHLTELANDSTIAGTNVQCPPLLPTSERKVTDVILPVSSDTVTLSPVPCVS